MIGDRCHHFVMDHDLEETVEHLNFITLNQPNPCYLASLATFVATTVSFRSMGFSDF